MIRDLAHACFLVRNLDESIAFYRDALGLTQCFDFTSPEGRRTGVYLKVGRRSFIELFEGQYPEPMQGSYRHICLEVDAFEDSVAELRRRGVEVERVSLGRDHSWQAWLKDPDGNPIELHGYTEDSLQKPFVE